MVQFLNNGGTLAIFDSLNLQEKKRMGIYAELKEMNPNIHFFWIECIGDDDDIMKEIFEQQYNNPDYLKMNQEEKKTDIADLISHHSQNYQHVSLDEKVPFLKIYNAGKHVNPPSLLIQSPSTKSTVSKASFQRKSSPTS